MALTRDQLRAAVAGELSQTLTLAGLTTADSSGHLKEPLDRTFRALGVAEADLATAAVDDGDEARALAYARYFALDRAVLALADQMQVSSPTGSANLKQRRDHVAVERDRALIEARFRGLALPGPGGVDPLPYTGGIDADDYAAVAESRMAPLFTVLP